MATAGNQSQEQSTIAHCDAVTKRYARGSQSISEASDATSSPTVTALDAVSLTVSRGEILAIAGPSGSGKSTLLHVLAALITPTEGTVSIDGTDITNLSARKRRSLRLSQIGIVFQHFHLLDTLSARSNVAAPLIELGRSKWTRRTQATEMLEAVELGDRIGHRPTELSGGEQQRVAIARALVTDPQLLIADEPTGELDTDTGEAILDLFREVATDRAVVLASHDEQVLSFADRVIHLQDGKRVADSS